MQPCSFRAQVTQHKKQEEEAFLVNTKMMIFNRRFWSLCAMFARLIRCKAYKYCYQQRLRLWLSRTLRYL